MLVVMHFHQADCCIQVDSTLIEHSSAFVVSSIHKIERYKVGRESPRVAHQEEHTPNFLAVEIRWFLRK